MPDIDVAWWNLENLFDRQGAPDRDPELASAVAGELDGWTAAVRDRKLDQLASVVVGMFDGGGPDLLGVCEVEYESVLQRLVDRMNAGLTGRDYRIAHHDSPDARGIDVSFVYDHDVLRVTDQDHQLIIKRTSTRDIFWIDIRVVENDAELSVFANHWPARSAGVYESEPYRMLVGETLSYLLRDLNHFPVLLMGDFNDEPFNRSMREYLLGTRDRGKVRRARNPVVWNLMWPLMAGENPGTYRHGSQWHMLDQFLANKAMCRSSSEVFVLPESVAIHRPDEMVGRGGRPARFGRPSRRVDLDGYSDHFPITCVLRAP